MKYARGAVVAGALSLSGLAIVFAAHGCGSDPPVPVDAALDRPTIEASTVDVLPDVSELDASDGGGTVDVCAPLAPNSGCVHPPVVESCGVGWCRIPHGCFILGSPPCEWGRGLVSENQAQVTLTHDFEIAQTETTQALWTSLGFSNPSGNAVNCTDDGGTCGDCIGAQCPVGNVSPQEAMAFANALSDVHQPPLPHCYMLQGCTGQTGGADAGLTCSSAALTTSSAYDCIGYRLPTEAEFEYAARGGTTAAFWNGGIASGDKSCRSDPHLEAIGWYCFNSGNFSHPVAQKAKNPWGLYDVAGNVVEYMSNDYSGAGYGKGPLVDPLGGLMTSATDARGGVATFIGSVCRSASRAVVLSPTGRAPLLGFRLVRTLPALDAGAVDAAQD